MKIINLRRCQGKTTRLLYASEFNWIPILCANFNQKKCLIEQANKLGLYIPEPIVVGELNSSKIRSNYELRNGLLVDEAPMVLQQLLNSIGVNSEVKAITLTSDELKEELEF